MRSPHPDLTMQRLTEITGATALGLEMPNDNHPSTYQMEARINGQTYYNAVTDKAVLANGDEALVTAAYAIWGMIVGDGHAHAVRCDNASEARNLGLARSFMRGADGMRDILTRPHGLSEPATPDTPVRAPTLDVASEAMVRDMMIAEALGLLMAQLGAAADAARGGGRRRRAQLHADLVQLAGTALALAAGVEDSHG